MTGLTKEFFKLYLGGDDHWNEDKDNSVRSTHIPLTSRKESPINENEEQIRVSGEIDLLILM